MTTTRSLLIATAGHVNHGKSTLLERLTGQHPDRLPQEKARGMTLDLGFVHSHEFSFIDCPGHERYVKHTTSGHSAIDGALFVVAANEGLQEQSFEHARILKWMGVRQILLVISKVDLISDQTNSEALQTQATKILGVFRSLFPRDFKIESVFFSKGHDPNILLSQMKRFFSPFLVSGPRQPESFHRFFIDRAFTLQGLGTVLTGTLSEGGLQSHQKVFLWIPGKKMRPVTIRALRVGHETLEKVSKLSRLALLVDGVHPAEVSRGSCLLWRDNAPSVEDLASNIALNLEFALPQNRQPKREFTAILQNHTLSFEVELRRHPEGFWRGALSLPLPLKKSDKVILRSPHRIKNFGHTWAGGEVLAVNLPRGKISLAQVKAEGAQAQEGNLKSEPPKSEPRSDPMTLPPVDQRVLEILFKKKWEAVVEDKDLQKAHDLVKNGLAFHIRENQFLHHEVNRELIAFLGGHFGRHETLNIDDARNFFKTGRKNFLYLLEYCDRHQWTFRTKLETHDVRKKFRLPSCSRPVASLQANEREHGRPTDRPHDLY